MPNRGIILYVDGQCIQNYDEARRLTYHFVWGPMRCRPILIGGVAARLRELFVEKAAYLGVALRHLEIAPDRVYAVVEAPPTLSPHSIVCGLKAHSSGPLRREFQEIHAMPTLWTRHYLVAAGDAVTTEALCAAYTATMPPRRPRGRPPCRPHAE